jgi:hypothetical protein
MRGRDVKTTAPPNDVILVSITRSNCDNIPMLIAMSPLPSFAAAVRVASIAHRPGEDAPAVVAIVHAAEGERAAAV